MVTLLYTLPLVVDFHFTRGFANGMVREQSSALGPPHRSTTCLRCTGGSKLARDEDKRRQEERLAERMEEKRRQMEGRSKRASGED
eukprot:gene37932-33453_t